MRSEVFSFSLFLLPGLPVSDQYAWVGHHITVAITGLCLTVQQINLSVRPEFLHPRFPRRRNVNEDIVQEILHELLSSLETLETQSAAVLQLLKDKGLASEQELALQLEKAGNASNVRWRAAQVRIDHLVSSAPKTAEREAKQQPSKPQEKSQESPTNIRGQTSRTSQGEEEVRNEQQATANQESADTSNEKNQGQQAKENGNEGYSNDARKDAA
jgi:DNA mismatch repair ATPase MutL